MKREEKVVIALCLITLVAYMYKLYIQNKYDTINEDVAVLRQRIDQVEYQNNKLQIEIDDAMSYRVIATRAAELGFIPATKEVNLWNQ